MTISAIETKSLTQKFGDYLAVNNLSLNVAQGEVFGFLGHNGAGKTSTIHMLTTLVKPYSGQASIFGESVVDHPDRVKQLIGYVPENVRLYDSLTTRENLLFFAGLSGIDDLHASVDRAMSILGILDLENKRVGQFSKGMRQRVGLTQAIVHQPKLLFLDEPASGLDPMGIKMLRDLIAKLNSELGITIFMNTHLISEVSKTCSSIGVLNHGQLIFSGKVDEVKALLGEENAVEDLYLDMQRNASTEVAL